MKKLKGHYDFPETNYVILTKDRNTRRNTKSNSGGSVPVYLINGYVDSDGTIIIDDNILPEEGFSLEYANYDGPLEDCEPINKN